MWSFLVELLLGIFQWACTPTKVSTTILTDKDDVEDTWHKKQPEKDDEKNNADYLPDF